MKGYKTPHYVYCLFLFVVPLKNFNKSGKIAIIFTHPHHTRSINSGAVTKLIVGL